jgi:hypothetical protein
VRNVGVVTTVVAGVLVAGAVAMGVASIPDVKRYLKIRNM